MKHLHAIAFLVLGLAPNLEAGDKPDASKIFGNIQFVDSFPDYRVKIVTAFPDLKVEIVNSFPDRSGKWRIVDAFPDYKIQIVEEFPDFTVQYVKGFPGPKH